MQEVILCRDCNAGNTLALIAVHYLLLRSTGKFSWAGLHSGAKTRPGSAVSAGSTSKRPRKIFRSWNPSRLVSLRYFWYCYYQFSLRQREGNSECTTSQAFLCVPLIETTSISCGV